LLLTVAYITSCKPASSFNATAIRDSVSQMTANIARDISAKGPAAWLDYFDDTPDFFMASNGQLVFKDYTAARAFIQNSLVRVISKINLRWHQVRIDAFSPDVAAVGADFHEDLTDIKGQTTAVDGYFTATAHHTANGWKLRNAHWSLNPKTKAAP
jgi:ketosteroid isomerase-like protein